MGVITTTRRIERFGRATPPTCKYWVAGRCNRNPCRFSHSLPTSPSNVYYNPNTTYIHSKKPTICAPKAVQKPANHKPKAVVSVEKPTKCQAEAMSVEKLIECAPKATSVEKATNCDQKSSLIEKTADVEDAATVAIAPVEKSRSICKYWMTDNCVHGDLCPNLHSWFYGDGFSPLAKLHEHNK
ncbi:hypothetical protein PIB30_063248, partial [Stylosanthes scabra]|nr:hypothetical protein [Stylosanthes scabra]